MKELRRPLFLAALACLVVAFVAELCASPLLLTFTGVEAATPGMGIQMLALLDGLVLFAVATIGLALIIPERIQGRVQGILTFIAGLIVIIVGIISLIIAFVLLILMVTLLLAAPFGTIAYFALWADFPTGAAKATLGALMLLKLCFAGLLLFSHRGFIGMKSLLLAVITVLLANFVVSFLHALVPGFLVSITDGIAALVVAILAIIWGIFYLVGGLISFIKAIG